MATFDEFVASLVANGERSGWASQNKQTGAYGKFQILPGNWRVWGPKALGWKAKGRPSSEAVADRVTPVVNWRPRATRAHQIIIARWRLYQMWLTHHGDAQRCAAAWESGNGNPAQWTARTIKYINRVCVPLGYAELPLPA